MIHYNNKEIGELYLLGQAISEVYQFAVLVWQAGNFLTADNSYFQTADGMMFYCKEE